MGKLLLGLAIAAVLLAVIVAMPQRGPNDHGWDWPWHDWCHSAWHQDRLHQFANVWTVTVTDGASAQSRLDQALMR